MTEFHPAPQLEDRFLEPPNWRWHSFTRKGRRIRFGSAFPRTTIPDAVVVCLPGLSEFSEKYFELARDLNARNMAFWVLDWAGQGKSLRFLKNRHKRHSTGFEDDVDDLQDFILGYIKHSSVHPDKGRIPLAMLAHSMGGHIGLRHLQKYPGMFECAAFSAPMFGLRVFQGVPKPLAWGLSGLLSAIAPRSYAPGAGDWSESLRPTPGSGHFSGDAVRDRVHNAWCLADPELQVGGVTYRWLFEAVRSCMQSGRKSQLTAIQTHCLLASAGHEVFVDNSAIARAGRLLPHAKTLHFPEAQHEILMEQDSVRNAFLDAFSALVKETIIDRPETLKPF